MPPIKTDGLNRIVRRNNEVNAGRLMDIASGYPLMYEPYQPSVPDTPTPLRYEPQPHYGLYEYPVSTGLAESYPITVPGMVSAASPAVMQTAAEQVSEPVEDLFSEEAMARRALKQRYAESNFNNRAKSHAGAMGAWQIMPITYKDYLGRGRGKAGDLNDPEYNRKVRDWVMSIIPGDLQDLYSENDAPRVKLAKIYGAYNWGAGNMRKYLRRQREAGVDISNDTSWVEGLNPETKRYIKYLALDEDIPDSTYTNKAFEEAAAKRGYMKEGGPIHIKPSHRGRLTELKERTGKTEAELYNDGNPAHKKMVVFARNARKWHGDGGLLDKLGGVYGNDRERTLDAIRKIRQNRFDGDSKDTGQMRRAPFWQRMVQVGSMAEAPAVMTAAGMEVNPDGTITYGNDSEGVRQLRKNLPVIGATGLGSFLGGSGLLQNFGRSVATGIDMMGRASMPSTVLKGIAGYFPRFAQTATMLSPYVDAAALTGYSYYPMRQMLDARAEGRTADAWGWGGIAALPVVGPAAQGIWNSGKRVADYIRFVSGRDPEYANILSRMKANQDATTALANNLGSQRTAAENRYGTYTVQLHPETRELAGSGVSQNQTLLSQYPTEIDFVPYEGAAGVRVPLSIEDLGYVDAAGTPARLTAPQLGLAADGTGMTLQYGATGRRRAMVPTFQDANGVFRSYPGEVLEANETHLLPGGTTRGDFKAITDNLFRYEGGNSFDSYLPVQRGIKGANAAIRQSVQNTEALIGESGRVTGSSQLYANDLLSGVPGDTEIDALAENLPALEAKLGTKLRQKAGTPFTYEGHSTKLPQGGEVEVHVLESDANGNAVGNMAWSYFKTLHPEAYNAELDAVARAHPDRPYQEFAPTNPATGRPYTTKEIFDEMQASGKGLQQIFNDAMGINKDYRRFGGNNDILKHDRPISFLTNHNPEVKQMVRTAIETNARAELGPNYVHGSEYFPNVDFNDVEANKAFLKAFNIKGEGIAEDPEMMRNIFDSWFLTESTGMRAVENMVGYKDIVKALFAGNHNYRGGNFAGAGLNTLRGGAGDVGMSGSQRGIMQVFPSFDKIMEGIDNAEDALKVVQNLTIEKGLVQLTGEETTSLASAIDKLIADFNSRSGASAGTAVSMLTRMKEDVKNIKSLTVLDGWLRDLGGGLPDPYAEEAVDALARAVGKPFITSRYYESGYLGKLTAGRPAASTVKIIPSGSDKNVFEIGRNLDEYAVNPVTKRPTSHTTRGANNNAVLTGENVLNNAKAYSQLTPEEREIYGALDIDYIPEHIQDILGGTFLRSPEVEAYDNSLQQMRDLAWYNENLGERASAYERMPLSRYARERAMQQTGLTRDANGRVVERNNGAPVPRTELTRLESRGIERALKGFEKGLYSLKDVKSIVRQKDGTIDLWIDPYGYLSYNYDPATGAIKQTDLPFAYGGTLRRMSKTYKGDRERMLEAIRKTRVK